MFYFLKAVILFSDVRTTNIFGNPGIPASVLQTAMAKSSEFEAGYGKRKHESEGELPDLIKDLLCVTERWSCQKDFHAINLNLLSELQKRAGLLVLES